MTPMRWLQTTLAVLALSLSTFGTGVAQPLSPLIVDWDRYFVVQSQPGVREGRTVATVWNTSLWNASGIQLLVEGLDGSGQPTSQRVVWLGSDLPAGTRADVDVPVSAAASYRVRVFAFVLDQAAGPR
jgi:hypothetical protein